MKTSRTAEYHHLAGNQPVAARAAQVAALFICCLLCRLCGYCAGSLLGRCSLVCLVLAASAADAQIPVDRFTAQQALLRAAKTAPVGSVEQGADIIGGTRTVRLAVLAGDGWAEAEAGGGRFTFRAYAPKTVTLSPCGVSTRQRA